MNIPYKNESNLIYISLKVSPILSLIIFILTHNGLKFSKEYSYSRRILYGLVLSLIADILICIER